MPSTVEEEGGSLTQTTPPVDMPPSPMVPSESRTSVAATLKAAEQEAAQKTNTAHSIAVSGQGDAYADHGDVMESRGGLRESPTQYPRSISPRHSPGSRRKFTVHRVAEAECADKRDTSAATARDSATSERANASAVQSVACDSVNDEVSTSANAQSNTSLTNQGTDDSPSATQTKQSMPQAGNINDTTTSVDVTSPPTLVSLVSDGAQLSAAQATVVICAPSTASDSLCGQRPVAHSDTDAGVDSTTSATAPTNDRLDVLPIASLDGDEVSASAQFGSNVEPAADVKLSERSDVRESPTDLNDDIADSIEASERSDVGESPTAPNDDIADLIEADRTSSPDDADHTSSPDDADHTSSPDDVDHVNISDGVGNLKKSDDNDQTNSQRDADHVKSPDDKDQVDAMTEELSVGGDAPISTDSSPARQLMSSHAANASATGDSDSSLLAAKAATGDSDSSLLAAKAAADDSNSSLLATKAAADDSDSSLLAAKAAADDSDSSLLATKAAADDSDSSLLAAKVAQTESADVLSLNGIRIDVTNDNDETTGIPKTTGTANCITQMRDTGIMHVNCT